MCIKQEIWVQLVMGQLFVAHVRSAIYGLGLGLENFP